MHDLHGGVQEGRKDPDVAHQAMQLSRAMFAPMVQAPQHVPELWAGVLGRGRCINARERPNDHPSTPMLHAIAEHPHTGDVVGLLLAAIEHIRKSSPRQNLLQDDERVWLLHVRTVAILVHEARRRVHNPRHQREDGASDLENGGRVAGDFRQRLWWLKVKQHWGMRERPELPDGPRRQVERCPQTGWGWHIKPAAVPPWCILPLRWPCGCRAPQPTCCWKVEHPHLWSGPRRAAEATAGFRDARAAL